MIPLDSLCIPRQLLKLKNSFASFCIVCTHQNVHYATINSNDDIILGEMKELGQPNQTNAVLVEVDGQLNVITYIVDTNSVNVYSDASPATYSLPSNINCASEPILHPIPAHEAFIVHCTTSSILYIVQIPIDSNQRALSIQADGYPHVNNMYIVIVNGNKSTTHTIDDLDKAGRPIIFQTKIKIIIFLNDNNMQVLTKDEHIVVDLNNTSLKPRYMEGRPTLYQWVDESNDYIYVTESNDVYTISIVNDSSTKAMYRRGGIDEQPQSLLYIRSSVDNPNFSNTPWYKEKVAKILYGVVAVIVLLAIFSMIIVPLVWRTWKNYSNLRRPPIASQGGVLYQVTGTDEEGVIQLDYRGRIAILSLEKNDPTVVNEADIQPPLPHPSTDPPHHSTTSPPPSLSSQPPSTASQCPTTDQNLSPPTSAPSTQTASPQPPSIANPTGPLLPPDNLKVINSDPNNEVPGRTIYNTTYDPSSTTHEESGESDNDDNDKTPLLSEPYSINAELIFPSPQQATTDHVPTVSSEVVEIFAGNKSNNVDSSAQSFMEPTESTN